jgi:hypothetical protein
LLAVCILAPLWAWAAQRLIGIRRRAVAGGLTALLLLAIGARLANGQETSYQHVTLWKVPYQQRAAFLEFQREVLKKVEQVRVNAGEFNAALLYEVVGAGTAGEYNFVKLISGPRPLEAFTTEQWQAWTKQAGVSWSPAYMRIYQPMMVRSMINRVSSRAGDGLKTGEVVAVRRFRANPGKGAMLEALHRNDGLPVMKELIRQGKVKTHTVSHPVFTGASTLPFTYSVGMGYGSQAEAIAGITASFREAFAKVHSGKKYEDYLQTLNDNRVPVRAELWRVVDRTDPKQ